MPDDLGSVERRLIDKLAVLNDHQTKSKEKSKLFSGGNSVAMWEMINSAKTVDDLRNALYLVCCRLQDLESKL